MIDTEGWIRKLMLSNELWKFYKTTKWLRLRDDVLNKHHYECQECLKQGKVTQAQTVHHINEVKKRPDLALCEFYTDEQGQVQRNLIPLCNKCHNKAHGRYCSNEYKPQLNEERW